MCPQEVCVHDYLAVRMCGEMLKDPTAPEVRLYAKTLSNLELSRGDTVRKDLLTLLQQLVQVPTCFRLTRGSIAATLKADEDRTAAGCETRSTHLFLRILRLIRRYYSFFSVRIYELLY